MLLGRLPRFCDVFSCLKLTFPTNRYISRGCQFQAAKNATIREGTLRGIQTTAARETKVEQNIVICQWRADQLFAETEG